MNLLTSPLIILLLAIGTNADDVGSPDESLDSPATSYNLDTVEPIEVPAIGRVADFGALYDVRTDQFKQINLFDSPVEQRLISSTHNRETKLQYTFKNTFDEKFAALDISGSLKLGIIAAKFELEASGRFFKDKKKSRRAARGSLITSFLTSFDRISMTSKDCKSMVDFDILETIDATHVVVGIQWGGRIFVTVEDANLENNDINSVEGKLEAGMKNIQEAVDVSGSGAVNISIGHRRLIERLSFEVYGDLVPTDGVPGSLIEALKFMKTAPKKLLEGNDGKGKAVKYLMLPLPVLRKLWKVQSRINTIVRIINDETIKKCVQFYDDMNFVEQKINDLHSDVQRLAPFVETPLVKQIKDLRINYDYYQSRFRKNLSATVNLVRAGNLTIDKLEEVLAESQNDPYSWQKTDLELKKYVKVQQEVNYLKMLQSMNVTLLSKYLNLQEFLWQNYNRDIFILFYNYEKINDGNFNATNSYRKMLEHRSYRRALFAAINYDVFREANEHIGRPEPGKKQVAKISYFVNGTKIAEDFDYRRGSKHNYTDDEQWTLAYIQMHLKNVMKVQDDLMRARPEFGRVPVGHVYVQLPNQTQPDRIWPGTVWNDVSREYAGLFFRTEGGQSKSFGRLQDEASPRIVRVENTLNKCPDVHANKSNKTMKIIDNNSEEKSQKATGWIYTGDQTKVGVNIGCHRLLQFHLSIDEVRPRNTAVKIWKRVK